MILLVLLFLLLLVFHPLLELSDGFALHGKLDVGVGRVNFRAWGMTHERHADFLQDAGLHQAGIEGVAEIVETDVAELRVFERSLPRTLHDADWLVFVANDQAFGLAVLKQVLQEPFGQGNLSGLPFGCLRTGDEQQLAREVDILPTLAGDLPAPHPRIEGGNDHGVEVALSCR